MRQFKTCTNFSIVFDIPTPSRRGSGIFLRSQHLGKSEIFSDCLQQVTHCHTSSHVSHQPPCSDRNPLHKFTVMDGDPSGVCHHQSTLQSTPLYCQQPIVKDRIQKNSMQLSRFVHISVTFTRGLFQLYDNNGDILRFQPWF